MAQTKAKVSEPTNNVGGVVLNGGTNAAGSFTTALTSMDLGKDEHSHGNKVVEITAGSGDDDDVRGVIKADSAGTFAYTVNPRTDTNNVITRGGGAANAGKINNRTTKGDLLTVPASEYSGVERGKQNHVTGTTALGTPTWTFPVLPSTARVPGLTDGNGQLGSGVVYPTASGTVGTDVNVNRTLAVPGEVTYRYGAPAPVTQQLRSRE